MQSALRGHIIHSVFKGFCNIGVLRKILVTFEEYLNTFKKYMEYRLIVRGGDAINNHVACFIKEQKI